MFKGSVSVSFFLSSISYMKEAKSTCPFSSQLLQFHKLVMLNTNLSPAEVSYTPGKRTESKAVSLINYPGCFLQKLLADDIIMRKNRPTFSVTILRYNLFPRENWKRKTCVFLLCNSSWRTDILLSCCFEFLTKKNDFEHNDQKL